MCIFCHQILAKRLQLSEPKDYLVTSTKGLDFSSYTRECAVEASPVSYLSQCYDRALSEGSDAKKVIIVILKDLLLWLVYRTVFTPILCAI